MELVAEVLNNQLYLYLPVALVLAGAILVFTFGFKSAEQPHFDKLSTISDDKKATSKKRKTKDKKVSVNGSAVPVVDKSTTKEKQSNKETPTTPKVAKSKEPEKKKPEVQKLNKSNTSEDQTNKKIVKAKTNEKPVDFDEGNWETVPTKNDKKTKKQDSPVKKSKKLKKVDSDNLTKEKDNQNDDNKESISKTDEIKNTAVADDTVADDIPVVEEKKVKQENSVELEKEVDSSAEESDAKCPIEKPVEDDLKDKDQEENTVDAESITKGGVAFDELGDVWTDTKAVKKSKKKSRRD